MCRRYIIGIENISTLAKVMLPFTMDGPFTAQTQTFRKVQLVESERFTLPLSFVYCPSLLAQSRDAVPYHQAVAIQMFADGTRRNSKPTQTGSYRHDANSMGRWANAFEPGEVGDLTSNAAVPDKRDLPVSLL